ncbi:MAG: Re/Si-specific NAD(P)(+) transhydrogenase subunit alpha [Bacteroidota bacterium]|nr:Re/Si-specific NAD(P)(+) transhydrogenase subunit alpha [Bacteroidota bacterium]MDP4234632.1 Re/Si-specific NAD(P)(+) transhydrogenase subunit alpha [Bacteroidota bacterium]MDP4243769.1 Re/Si-specific NAD(P)(+) transhydrogenase subunit alpha [Bacteroidota bacterium]MDP4289329.1 Re/Si-specific NAD(P)(+) transhydrogenase subunit alpha [Bacteroidota bacterium]
MSETSLPQTAGVGTVGVSTTPINTNGASHALIIGIPKEVYPGERRVAATPETSQKLQKLGFEVRVESGAGEAADFPDARYEQAGCKIVRNAQDVWSQANIILKVRAPQPNEVDQLSAGQMLISYLAPAQNAELLQKIAARKANAIAIDIIPRISRAQKEDALSSMANISGYRGVIEAANLFPRFFTGQITAAGKIPPAKILVIGAGVAGLAAIGAGRALGAIVRAFDVRPAVKEQIQSMGAEFLEVKLAESGEGEGGYAKEMSKEFIEAEMALFAKQAKDVDIIVTTALIPGRPAPKLITRAMVESMKEGSVIVDLAAEAGGNCELTQPGAVAKHGGVSIIGYTDLPSRMAPQASQLYGMNLYHLLDDMGGSAKYRIDMEDDVVRGALVVHDGSITWPPPKPKVAPPVAPKAATTAKPVVKEKKKSNPLPKIAIAVIAFVGLTLGAPPTFLSHFTVFILAIFVGWQVIWNVTPALHTPLMSVTNAISGIIIIGGLLQIGGTMPMGVMVLGFAAIFLATINIAGGFLVTQRMLKMFRK